MDILQTTFIAKKRKLNTCYLYIFHFPFQRIRHIASELVLKILWRLLNKSASPIVWYPSRCSHWPCQTRDKEWVDERGGLFFVCMFFFSFYITRTFQQVNQQEYIHMRMPRDKMRRHVLTFTTKRAATVVSCWCPSSARNWLRKHRSTKRHWLWPPKFEPALRDCPATRVRCQHRSGSGPARADEGSRLSLPPVSLRSSKR